MCFIITRTWLKIELCYSFKIKIIVFFFHFIVTVKLLVIFVLDQNKSKHSVFSKKNAMEGLSERTL